jgi:hypothetical protein
VCCSGYTTILPSRQPTPTSQVAGKDPAAGQCVTPARHPASDWPAVGERIDLKIYGTPCIRMSFLFSPMTRTRRASGGGGRLRVTGCQWGIGGGGQPVRPCGDQSGQSSRVSRSGIGAGSLLERLSRQGNI